MLQCLPSNKTRGLMRSGFRTLLVSCAALLLSVSISTARVLDLETKISHQTSAKKAQRASMSEAAFFNALGQRESGNDYRKVNGLGYAGKYQFGESALIDMGYYIKDATRKNDWQGQWTGKDGIYSIEDLLSRKAVQEKIARNFAAYNWQIAVRYGLHKYVGKHINGVKVTKAGMLAGMHLKGFGGVKDFIIKGQNSKDAYGTEVKEYMLRFNKHTVSF